MDGNDEDDVITLPVGLISDDDADDEVPITKLPPISIWTTPTETSDVASNTPTTPQPMDFNLNGPPTSLTASEGEGNAAASTTTSATNVIIEEEDRQRSNLAGLLMLHHQYGHISMRKLPEMAKQGTIPRRLAKCRIRTCLACLYSTATKKPWQGKTTKLGKVDIEPQRVGQVIWVDQLVSPTPALIAQMTGFLTTKRYKYAMVYVDQHSQYGYVHLQNTASAEETVEEKLAIEAHTKRHGVRIENYHADNSIFKARLWVDECQRNGQGVTYAGVNAHHQNGKAERRIRELQEIDRAMLIHANARWSGSIT